MPSAETHSLAGSGAVLGFDVGARRIGVAVGSRVSDSARDLAVVSMRDDGPDWPALDRLVREWAPAALVVGDPRLLDDEVAMPPSRRRARQFAEAVHDRYRLPTWLIDERSSSVEAARRFADARAAGARRRREAERLDAMAAVVILERWLRAGELAQPWPAP